AGPRRERSEASCVLSVPEPVPEPGPDSLLEEGRGKKEEEGKVRVRARARGRSPSARGSAKLGLDLFVILFYIPRPQMTFIGDERPGVAVREFSVRRYRADPLACSGAPAGGCATDLKEGAEPWLNEGGQSGPSPA